MAFNLRPTPFALYRLFFILLIYGIGIISTCVWILESFTRIQIFTMEPGTSYDALLATSGVTGIIGIVAGSILLSFMTDRRTVESDRRQREVDIGFPDRRQGSRRLPE